MLLKFNILSFLHEAEKCVLEYVNEVCMGNCCINSLCSLNTLRWTDLSEQVIAQILSVIRMNASGWSVDKRIFLLISRGLWEKRLFKKYLLLSLKKAKSPRRLMASASMRYQWPFVIVSPEGKVLIYVAKQVSKRSEEYLKQVDLAWPRLTPMRYLPRILRLLKRKRRK